jgi:WD40 repeat protein
MPREVRRLDGHDDIPLAIAFSPNGKIIATDGETCRAQLWDAKTGAHIRSLTPVQTTYVAGLAWSNDGERLAGSDNDHANIWNVNGGAPLDLGAGTGGWRMAWSPDGLLATGYSDGAIRLWRTDGVHDAVTLTGHKKAPSPAWSPDGKTLASGADDGVTILWDRVGDEWKPRELAGRQGKVRWLRWSPDGTVLATAGEDGTVCLWDRTSGGNLHTLHASADAVRTLAWRDARTLISISNDGTERLWDAGTGALQRAVHRDRTYGVVFSPDAEVNAVGCGAFTVRLWETETGRPLGTSVLLNQGWLVLSADGHYSCQNSKVEGELVYVVQTEGGQQTLSVADFGAAHHWNNEPKRARLDTR